ncbi:MAG: hypothetical protein KVP17_004575 [Porospora cf. gigantea B]|uniref:uncharacterized protein n=1 Tax=Porospora cf. gigantea B TaxID=2853592 RepID=UPI003571DE10|nr:MAG: hypothetical protein KVP17_004575 [Porospora cf. gigantea B]
MTQTWLPLKDAVCVLKTGDVAVFGTWGTIGAVRKTKGMRFLTLVDGELLLQLTTGLPTTAPINVPYPWTRIDDQALLSKDMRVAVWGRACTLNDGRRSLTVSAWWPYTCAHAYQVQAMLRARSEIFLVPCTYDDFPKAVDEHQGVLVTAAVGDLKRLCRLLCQRSPRRGQFQLSRKELDLIASLPDVHPQEDCQVIELDESFLLSMFEAMYREFNDEEKAKRLEYHRLKKRPQWAWMVRRLTGLLKSLDGQDDPLLVDVGGGKGELAMVACRALGLRALVLDINADAIKQGEALAAELDLPVSFAVCSVDDFDFDALSAPCIFMGLHLCGGLTDCLLQRLRSRSEAFGVLVVTCCFTKFVEMRKWGPSTTPPWDQASVLFKLSELSEENASIGRRASYAINLRRLELFGRGSCCRVLQFPACWSIKNLAIEVSCSDEHR